MSDSVNKFEIWVELDQYETTEEKHFHDDEFCNVIHFLDGSQIGLNVWSEKYFFNNVNNLDWIDEQVALLPDILVRNFNTRSIRQAIINLISKYNWLERRGFPAILVDTNSV